MGQVFEISNFKDGLDRSVEPWLTMDDAMIDVDNYQVFRGVIRPRYGIQQYAQGGRGNAEREESRIYSTTTDQPLPVTTQTFTYTLAAHVRPGSVTFTETGGDTATDDGMGGFVGGGFSSGTIDYYTGIVTATWTSGVPTAPTVTWTHSNSAVSVINEDIADVSPTSGTLANIPVRENSVVFFDGGTQYAYDDGLGSLTGDATGSVDYVTGDYSITWTGAVGGDAVVSYVQQDCNPVMMIANFISETNVNELIVASKTIFNKYVSGDNRFEEIPFAGTAAAPTGNKAEYFSWTGYFTKANRPRLMMVNNKDPIYSYDGIDVKLLSDNADYEDPAEGTLNTALHVEYFGQRLVCFRPTVGAEVLQNHVMWTGINDNSGTGFKFQGAGSGRWELSAEDWITAVRKLRDSVIIFTSQAIFEMTKTQDIDFPFKIKQIGDSIGRGARGPFSSNVWFGECNAIGPLGVIGTDGREAFRVDNKIPFFTRDRMNGLEEGLEDGGISINAYDLIYGETVYNNDQFWFTYCDINDVTNPDLNDDTSRVLTSNFVEDSWSVYSLPIKTIGQYKNVIEWPWDDVNEEVKASWAQWDTTDERWDSFQNQENAIITILGDKCGFLYSYEGETDQCTLIDAVTQGEITTFTCLGTETFRVGELVFIEGVEGLEENGESVVNFSTTGRTFEIDAVSYGNSTITIEVTTTDATAYVSGGTICKLIPREFFTKPLNPFIKQAKKCRLEKIKFFYDTDKTPMKVDLYCDRRKDPYMQNIVLDDGDNRGDQVKKWSSIRVNQTANFHTIKIHQEDGNADERLHAIVLECSPVGRLER
jgi:hypothetical protein